ncbi:MAG: prepilin-type N-terminal cleavage/methylation domain-containing protein [Puniceicoccaceae bacterium]|nr:MAG: prepilin-type N-terminal cleavage/methylation domain-containing protein [Puniceicoccaceae bacterium]
MKLQKSTSSRSSKQGFTILELAIAMAIMTVLMIAFYQLTLASTRVVFDTEAKLRITRDVRTFTGELSRSGLSASIAYIYPNRDTVLTSAARLPEGGTGDFVLFIRTEPFDDTNPSSSVHITRLTAYIREVPVGALSGPVVQYRQDFAMDESSRVSRLPTEENPPNTAESMAAAMLLNTEPREVLQLSRGLANERLFINYAGRSVVVNGEILHGNNNRRLTNTYNFTITPRG